TGVLRWIAERHRIYLAPEFSATYHGRESFKKFAAQAYFRGTTFVDSYLGSPGPARNGLFAAFGVGLLGLGLAAKRPKTAVVLAAGYVLTLVATRWLGPENSKVYLSFWGILMGLGSALSPLEQELSRQSAVAALDGGKAGKPALRALTVGAATVAVVAGLT